MVRAAAPGLRPHEPTRPSTRRWRCTATRDSKYCVYHQVPERYRRTVQAVGEEFLVYDPLLLRAHCLSPEAAAVYHACDGQSRMEDVAQRLSLSPDLVLECLKLLNTANLVAWKPGTLDRRAFMGLASRAAGVPLVSSIFLPVAAAALSVTCATTGGDSGCGVAGLPASGGGDSGLGPAGCEPCCGSPSLGNCGTCPDDCGSCHCLRAFLCSNDGTNQVRCDQATNPDICAAVTTDTAISSAREECVRDGFSLVGDVSCAAARAKAAFLALPFYQCCSCS